MKLFTRRLIALGCFALLGIAMAVAQTTTTHIVDRGETLASIAQKYGTTEARIIELNPDAAQYVYVGMELQIPAATAPAPATTVQSTPRQQTYTQPAEAEETTATQSSSQSYLPSSQTSSSVSSTTDESPWLFLFNIGIGWPKDLEMSFEGNVGAGYKFYQDLFVSARLGYLAGWNNKRDYEIKAGAIVLPIDLGVDFDFNEKKTLGIQPFLGVQPGISITKKVDIKQGSKKVETVKYKTGKLCADFHVGCRLKFFGWNAWVGYSIPINKDQKNLMGKDGYVSCGIGVCF